MPDAVAFDAGPVRARPTGVGVYVRELAHALRRLRDGDIHLIGARRAGPLATDASTLMGGDRHLAWIVRRADADARGCGAGLAHYTNAVAPARTSMPFALTIHDLSLVRYPHYHPGPRLAVVPFMAWGAHRAKRVIAPSRSTADEVHRLLRVPARRIEVIEEAPVRGPDPRAEERDAVLDELNLAGRRFVLTLATLEPRKNVVNLVRAFERLAGDEPDLWLVLGGGSGWRTRAIERALATSSAAGRIRRLGYVRDLARSVLLRECAAFAYVSLYEGYGLPVVEAMDAGAPVVTSNLSSMPEAAGGAAVLVDPHDPDAIADGLRHALGAATELRVAGRARAGSLSWDRAARETNAVYERIAARWI